MENDHAPAPLACSLGKSDRMQRAERWKALVAGAIRQQSQTRRGVRLAFADDPGVADELNELAALERDCCAFATWSVSRADGQVVLDVSGDSEQAAAAVQAMLAGFR
jgi:hypothetical protein